MAELYSRRVTGKGPRGYQGILRGSVLLDLSVTTVSTTTVVFNTSFVTAAILNSDHTVTTIEVLPLSLPFVTVDSMLHNCFVSEHGVFPGSVNRVLRRATHVVVVILFVGSFVGGNLTTYYFKVVLNSSLTRTFNFLLLFISCFMSVGNFGGLPFGVRGNILEEVLRVDIPVASKHCLGSLLHANRGILMPGCLDGCHFSAGGTLSRFNVVGNVTLPLLFFPSTVLGTISALLVPRVSRTIAGRGHHTIGDTDRGIVGLALLYKVVYNILFFFNNRQLNILVCGSASINFLLGSLSPVIPLVCLSDVYSKVLGKLSRRDCAFGATIDSSTIHVTLVVFVLPGLKVENFVLVVCFSGLCAYLLGINELVGVDNTGLGVLGSLLLPLLSTIAISVISAAILKFLSVRGGLICVVFLYNFSATFCAVLLCFLRVVPRGHVGATVGVIGGHWGRHVLYFKQ